MSTVLAVDGGNPKTDLAIIKVSACGEICAAPCWAYAPHHVGVAGSVERIGALYDQAMTVAGRARAQRGRCLHAGGSRPQRRGEEALHVALSEQPWVDRALVRNDTFAVLRSAGRARQVVAVVCGAGINCVGVAADGRTARFPALGAITGDWGGGYDLGLAALGAAVRGDDARDEPTSLSRIVPEFFEMATAEDVAIALHTRQLSGWRLADLSPLVVAAERAGDVAAGALVDRLAAEVAGHPLAALARLGMLGDEVDVVLGGGCCEAGSARLDDGIDAIIHAAAPRRMVHATQPPVVGAAVLALDEAGAVRRPGPGCASSSATARSSWRRTPRRQQPTSRCATSTGGTPPPDALPSALSACPSALSAGRRRSGIGCTGRRCRLGRSAAGRRAGGRCALRATSSHMTAAFTAALGSDRW
jgi:N-acetylglucosamine kinase-like BadF-type ATPase